MTRFPTPLGSLTHKGEKQMARRKALKSLTFATATLSVCFIVDEGSPLHAQGAYQPGAAFQSGVGGASQPGATFQPGIGGAFQPGAVFQPGIGGAYQPGITGPYQPSISGAPPPGGTAPLSGQFQPSSGGPSQPKGR
jgi:hypothetical protein